MRGTAIATGIDIIEKRNLYSVRKVILGAVVIPNL